MKMITRKIVRLINMCPNKMFLAGSLFCFCLISIIEVGFGFLIKSLMEVAITRQMSQFVYLLSFTIGLIGIDLLLHYMSNMFSAKFTEKGMVALRKKAVKHIANFPMRLLEETHSGDYLSRMTNDVAQVREFLINTVEQVILIPLKAVASFIYLSFLNWQLTIVSVLFFPVLLFISSKLSRPIANLSQNLQERFATISTVEKDTIAGIGVAKSLNLHDEFVQMHRVAVDQVIRSARELFKQQAIVDTFANCIQFAPFLVTFGLGGYMAVQGRVTTGALMAFIYLISNLVTPMEQMPRLIAKVKSNMASVDRIFQVLDISIERTDGQNFISKPGQSMIEFKDVTLIINDKVILQNVSFQIHEGEKIAFVGASGAGKSTILKLLLGFYDEYTGTIFLNGEDIRKWSLVDLREQISYVSQETFLFPDDIRTNIAVGNLTAIEDEIVGAAKAASAHEFIMSLDAGYGTHVGELGNRLSGGQRQRISIARAFLKNAKILLLDEPTAALDFESERLLQGTLDNLMRDRTSCIVAHRLSTVKSADRLMVLDQGRIVEIGSHNDLLAMNGVYSSLYRQQMQENPAC